MCRYGFKNYKTHYVCFDCRKTFKKHTIADYFKGTKRADAYEQLRWVKGRKKRLEIERSTGYTLDELVNEYREKICKCPQCSERMASMGMDFKAPKQSDVKKWKIIQGMVKLGHRWQTCGCDGPGYIPVDPVGYREYLEQVLTKFTAYRDVWLDDATQDPKQRPKAIAAWNSRIAAVQKELAKVD